MNDRVSSTAGRARPAIAIGLFLVCLATLVMEIGLTRLLSVTVWYHFSFAAVSLALLGMSAGSVVVYVRRERWLAGGRPPGVVLSRAASVFALGTAAALVVYLQVDLGGDLAAELPWLRLLPALVFVVPFVASGVVVSLVLTAYARDVSRLYFWDLVGAGLGGLVLVGLIDIVSGPSVILAMGALGGVAALLFAFDGGGGRDKAVAAATLAVAVALFASNLAAGWLSVRYTKAYDETEMPLVYEKWGPMARLAVFDKHWARGGGAYGWGMSETYQGPVFPEKWVEQDAAAGTPITQYDGDPAKLVHLGYDVTAVPYYLLDKPEVAVVGLGGGRDALTALHFGAERVVGIEVNADMLALTAEVFRDFAGGLLDDPRVEPVVADGRSYLAHADRSFDLIQISLIDSWAASAAGAFVLAENSLYTAEAFQTYWERLTEGGLLSISRWCMSERPGELLRLVSLALGTLRDAGVEEPGRHIAVVSYRNKVGTVLLKRTPFTAGDIGKLTRVCDRMGFDLPYLHDHADSWASFTELVGAYGDLESYWAAQPMDISPPTDDRPFFFLILRLADALDSELSYELGLPYNATAVRTLGALLVAVVGLVLLLILAPLRWFAGHGLAEAPHRGRFLLYFACLGLGYILIEIPLIQQFILFLGHPTYALTVVLSTLLVASGVGSRLTGDVSPDGVLARAGWVLVAIVVLGVVFVLALGPVLNALLAQPLWLRVVLAVVLLAPLGVVMGMPFPLGVKLVEREDAEAVIPWVWGTNGATSVLATVLAFVLALGSGYSRAMLVGLVCYALAAGLVARWQR